MSSPAGRHELLGEGARVIDRRTMAKLPAPAAAMVLLLVACAGEPPLPDDAIKNEAAAISAGQKVCGTPDYLQDGWHATLHDRVWHVWYCDARLGRCPTFQTDVNAADGKALSQFEISAPFAALL